MTSLTYCFEGDRGRGGGIRKRCYISPPNQACPRQQGVPRCVAPLTSPLWVVSLSDTSQRSSSISSAALMDVAAGASCGSYLWVWQLVVVVEAGTGCFPSCGQPPLPPPLPPHTLRCCEYP